MNYPKQWLDLLVSEYHEKDQQMVYSAGLLALLADSKEELDQLMGNRQDNWTEFLQGVAERAWDDLSEARELISNA